MGLVACMYVRFLREGICGCGGLGMGGLRCRCGFCPSGLFVEVVGNGVVEGGDK